MARKVMCKITGECGTSDSFYKAPDGKYYKTEQIYNEFVKNNEIISQIISFVMHEILHTKNSSVAAIIRKEINSSNLPPSVILDSIVNDKESILKIIDGKSLNAFSEVKMIFNYALNHLRLPVYAGCYEIKNNDTGEVYIGESVNIFQRFNMHISDLYNGKHHCKKLQEAFNVHRDISHFTFTPLYMWQIISYDKKALKEETLYLESAYYLKYRNNKKALYNTTNPYIQLKENNVTLDGYDIDCKQVLINICNDKYGVLTKDLKKKILKDLNISTEESCNESSNNVSSVKQNPYVLENGRYQITKLIKYISELGIIPKNYDYSKIRELLIENGLITIDEKGYTVATQYSLDNELFVYIKTQKDGRIKYELTEKCKEEFIKIFDNIDINALVNS